jgi:hypothetical protein
LTPQSSRSRSGPILTHHPYLDQWIRYVRKVINMANCAAMELDPGTEPYSSATVGNNEFSSGTGNVNV